MTSDQEKTKSQLIAELEEAREKNSQLENHLSSYRKANEILPGAEECFQFVYENMAIGLAQVSLDFRILDANPAYCQMLGYCKEELIGKHLRDITHPEIIEENLQKQSQLASGEIDYYRMEKQFIHKNGQIIHGILDANLIRGTKGNPLYFLGSVFDITRRKQAEEALKKSERLLSESQNIARIGGWEYVVKENKITWTDEVYRICGVSKEEYDPNDIGQDIQFYAPGDRHKIEQAFTKAVNKGESYDLKLRFISAKGDLLWVRTMGRPVMEDGQIKKVVGNIIDITLLKEAEEKVRESEKKYKKLINTSPDGVALVDEDGRFLTVNPAMAKRFGLTPEDLEGLTHHEVMPKELADNRIEKGKEAIEQDDVIHLEGKRNEMYYQNYFIPISTDGKQRTFQVIARDITEIRQTQNKLEQTLSKLNQSVKGTFQVLSSALEHRDPYTAGHQERVTQLACAIAREKGLEEDRIQGLYFAGMVHDIGKISIPAEILAKPSQLTDLEFGLMKSHVQAGYNILKDIEFPWPIADIVVQHHERLDGSGYPAGLSGKDIIQEARILAVADVVEAMTSHRPYRPGLGIDVALKEIESKKGLLFDEDAVDTCLMLFREKGYTFGSMLIGDWT